MKVTQLTVFLENRSGRLAEIADILGQEGINIRGFSTTEAAEYGIVRLIVPDAERARELLHDAGFTTHLSQVICVRGARRARRARQGARRARRAEISVDYLYSISFQNICFAVHDIDRAIELLKDKVTLLSDDDVRVAVSAKPRPPGPPRRGRRAASSGSRRPRRMPRRSSHDLQIARLRETLRNAYDNVPFYRKKLDEAGIAPESVSLPRRHRRPAVHDQDRPPRPLPVRDVRRAAGRARARPRLVGHDRQPDVVGYARDDVDALGRSHRAHAGRRRPGPGRHAAERLRLRPVHRRPGPALRRRAARAPPCCRSPAATPTASSS